MDIDLTFPTLPAGRYDAVIESIELKRYTTVLLGIGYRVPHKGHDFRVWEELPIDAPLNSPSYSRTAQGKSRVYEILTAFGEQPPPRIFAPDLEDALVGREVHIAIRHKQSGTFAVPIVTAVLGKARNPVPGPVGMTRARIRFGTHAFAIFANGWRSIIPVRGKRPDVPEWPSFGTVYPTTEQIGGWVVSHGECGVGCVMDGRLVAVDVDICPDRFRALGFTVKDAAREAPTLVLRIKKLAIEALGPIDFARVGLPPKVMIFYAAADAVPTIAGGPVEVFSAPGSKQVVIGGFHPEGVDDYRWVGRGDPVRHSIDALHPVTAKQVMDFRACAIEMSESAGLKPPPRVSSANGDRPSVSSGIVGEYMSEVLSLIGKNPGQVPCEIAAEYFRQSIDGEKHYRMAAVCGALILRRFTDEEIISALSPVYLAIVSDDPSMSRLRVCPPRMRAGMRARGTNVTTLAEIDAWLGPNWSIRNG